MYYEMASTVWSTSMMMGTGTPDEREGSNNLTVVGFEEDPVCPSKNSAVIALIGWFWIHSGLQF